MVLVADPPPVTHATLMAAVPPSTFTVKLLVIFAVVPVFVGALLDTLIVLVPVVQENITGILAD